MLHYRVNVTIDFDQLSNQLSSLDKKLSDLTPFWHSFLPVVQNIFKDIFEGEGSTSQTPHWLPLSPGYAARKARDFPGQPIGQRTGQLYESIIDNPDISIEPDSLTIGTHTPYAQYFEAQRPIFGYTATVAPAILQQEIIDYLEKS